MSQTQNNRHSFYDCGQSLLTGNWGTFSSDDMNKFISTADHTAEIKYMLVYAWQSTSHLRDSLSRIPDCVLRVQTAVDALRRYMTEAAASHCAVADGILMSLQAFTPPTLDTSLKKYEAAQRQLGRGWFVINRFKTFADLTVANIAKLDRIGPITCKEVLLWKQWVLAGQPGTYKMYCQNTSLNSEDQADWNKRYLSKHKDTV